MRRDTMICFGFHIDDEIKQNPQWELIERALEIHDQLVKQIFTTQDADGTVVVHNSGCPLLESEPHYYGKMPDPKLQRQCKCMPQLMDIMASLRH
jgi:hypothetical protein